MKGAKYMYQPKRKHMRRDHVIGVRLTEAEMMKAKEKASVSCISLSSWAREIIKDYLSLCSEAEKEQ